MSLSWCATAVPADARGRRGEVVHVPSRPFGWETCPGPAVADAEIAAIVDLLVYSSSADIQLLTFALAVCLTKPSDRKWLLAGDLAHTRRPRSSASPCDRRLVSRQTVDVLTAHDPSAAATGTRLS